MTSSPSGGAPRPRISLLIPIDDTHAPGLAAALQAHGGPGVELFVLDLTRAGLPAAPGAQVLRPPVPDLGLAVHLGAHAATADAVGLRHPGALVDPALLEAALAALNGADLVLSPYALAREDGEITHVVDPGQDGDAPPPCWTWGMTWRRGAPLTSPAVGTPTLLAGLRALRAAGRVQVLPRAYLRIPHDAFAQARMQAGAEPHLLTVQAHAYGDDVPWASVLVVHAGDLSATWATADGALRQLLPTGTMEVLVASDAHDGALEALRGLASPAALRVVAAEPGSGRGGALQAGLEAAQGQLLILLEAGLRLRPDVVEQHIRAHRDRGGQLLVGIGAVELDLGALEAAGARAPSPAAEPDLSNPADWSFAQLSAPVEALRLAGGFDPGVPAAGVALDLAWRLARDGYLAIPVEKARAFRAVVEPVADRLARVRAEAAAEIAVFRRSPEALDRSCLDHLSAEGLEQSLAPHAASLGVVREAAEALAATRVGAIERLGGEWSELADDLGARLERLLTHLDKVARMQGHLDGLRAAGCDRVAALRRFQPLLLPGRRSTVYVARPCKDDELGWLGVIARFLSGFGPADDHTLLLLADPANGGEDPDQLRGAILELTRRMNPGPRGGWADVQIARCVGDDAELVRTLAACQAWVSTGHEGDARLGAVAAELGLPAADAEAWTLRGTGGVEPHPVATRARFRLLASPDWGSADALEALLREFATPLVNRDDAALVLRIDVEGLSEADGEAALVRLAEAYERVMPPGDALEVVLLDDDARLVAPERLAAAVQAVVPSPDPLLQAAIAAGAPVAHDAVGVHTAMFSVPPLPLGPLYAPTMTLV